MNKPKTIFIGSGEFAVVVLERFLKDGSLDLQAVITQPDKPVGRKQVMTPPPLKDYLEDTLLEKGIDIIQPNNIKASGEEIVKEYKPELIIVADYGQIIPQVVLDYPKYKCLNIHGSLLPDLRGAAPIQMAILHGYKETGVSIPIMTPGLDDGPVIATATLEVGSRETTPELRERLGELGARLLLKILPDWLAGKIEAKPQVKSKATFAPIVAVSKDKAFFDENTKASEIDRKVRAFYPDPAAWTKVSFNDKTLRLKLYQTGIPEKSLDNNVDKGTIMKQGKKLYLYLGKSKLELKELQLEGKNRASAKEYLYLSEINLID